MKIINLTQHVATGEQITAGVVDVPSNERDRLSIALTFDALPTMAEIEARANNLAGLVIKLAPELAVDSETVGAMIGGAPYLMSALEQALIAIGAVPMYAFSIRESTEQLQTDSSVRKVNIFRHAGFISVTQ